MSQQQMNSLTQQKFVLEAALPGKSGPEYWKIVGKLKKIKKALATLQHSINQDEWLAR